MLIALISPTHYIHLSVCMVMFRIMFPNGELGYLVFNLPSFHLASRCALISSFAVFLLLLLLPPCILHFLNTSLLLEIMTMELLSHKQKLSWNRILFSVLLCRPKLHGLIPIPKFRLLLPLLQFLLLPLQIHLLCQLLSLLMHTHILPDCPYTALIVRLLVTWFQLASRRVVEWKVIMLNTW